MIVESRKPNKTNGQDPVLTSIYISTKATAFLRYKHYLWWWKIQIDTCAGECQLSVGFLVVIIVARRV